MKSFKYRAVLWDFDGVIFDSDRAVWHAANAVLSAHGLEQEPYEKFRHRTNNHFKWYLERGVPWSEQEVRAFFFKNYDSSTCGLIPGVHETLAHFHRQGVRCGIVSAHRYEDVVAKLERFGIARYFSHVVGDAYHKQEALKDACTVFEVESVEALFVGDMLSDVIDGKAAGVITVLFAPIDSPHAAQAHHHITDLAQLQTLIVD